MSVARNLSHKVGGICALAIALFYLVAPAYWMVKSSVSPDAELRMVPPPLLPKALTFDHFKVILQLPGFDAQLLRQNIELKFFPKAMGNSLIVASASTVVATFLGAVSAYSLCRFVRPRTRKWVMLGLLVSRMLPLISILIPIYMMLLATGLLDTITGLIVVYSGLLLPFVIWILEGFYRQFPTELEEAAVIDGASKFVVFTKVVMPLSWNGLFAAGVFVFISVWSDFMVGFIMTNTERAYTLSVVVARNLSSWREPDWGVLNAAGVSAALVPIVLAFVLRGLVAGGRLAGALKG